LNEFLGADVKSLTREQMLEYKRAIAINDFDGMGFTHDDYIELMENHVPWAEQPDDDLRANLREVQSDWLASAAEQAERKAGWDPNP
jgi:hypothetical protein